MTFAQPFKDYEILERIGSGAMGTVFRARQKRLDRIVALKVLKPSLARNTKFVERLRREARIVASLNHPDIVAGYDLGDEGGYHFFVMEFVEGQSLATLLKEWGTFPQEQVLDVATRVASALDHAFKKGVIHRDVKPGNILIDREGRAKLTDMGLAKAPEDVTITQEGATVGTPQYISPEQARDPAKADVRSDLYSLGATMFHMCTGQPPFVGTTLANVIHEVIHRRAPAAAEINPAVSPGLSLVIKKLLAKDPGLRYQTPAELLTDLHRVRRAERPQVDEGALAADQVPGPGQPARRWLLVPLAALLVVAGGAAVAWWPRRAPAPAATPPALTLADRTQAALAAAVDWRAKLRVLAQAAADASSDPERRAVADLRAGVLAQWQDALVKFVRDKGAGVPAFVLLAEHWRDPARVWRANVTDDLERSFGLSRAELPAELAQVLDAELERLDAEVAARVNERDENLLAAFRAHLEGEVTARWRGALEQCDFAAAERALRAGGATFFGEAGRPRLEHLSAAAAREIAEVEERAVAPAMAQIERAEGKAAEELQRAAQDAIAELRELLRGDVDPRQVQQRYLAWRRDLGERHPESRAFRSGQNPWPRIADIETTFRAALGAAVAGAEQRRLNADVHLALAALLADGDASQEVRWLRERAMEDPRHAAQRDHWAQLLVDAHAARDWLLETLAARLGARTVPVSDLATGRMLQIGVRRDNGQQELVEREGARVRRISLAALRVSEVIDHATPQGGSAIAAEVLDRGLALWLYCAGETSLAAKRLPAADRAFFGEQVAHAVLTALRQRLGHEGEAREALARLRRDYLEMPAIDLRDALDGFGNRFGQTVVGHTSVPVLQELRAHLRAREEQAQSLAALRAAVPAGLHVALAAEGRARVTCDPSAGGELPLAAGWQRRDDRLEFTATDVRLDAVRHLLILPDGLSTEHGVRFTGAFAFAAQGSKPRLYLLEVHGVGVALGLIASGEPFAVVLAVEDLARDKVLQRELEERIDALVEPRAGVPWVVVGARHLVSIEVRVQQGQRLAARVHLDGVEIAAGNVARLPRVSARVAILPLQPLTLWKAEIEGRP